MNTKKHLADLQQGRDAVHQMAALFRPENYTGQCTTDIKIHENHRGIVRRWFLAVDKTIDRLAASVSDDESQKRIILIQKEIRRLHDGRDLDIVYPNRHGQIISEIGDKIRDIGSGIKTGWAEPHEYIPSEDGLIVLQAVASAEAPMIMKSVHHQVRDDIASLTTIKKVFAALETNGYIYRPIGERSGYAATDKGLKYLEAKGIDG